MYRAAGPGRIAQFNQRFGIRVQVARRGSHLHQRAHRRALGQSREFLPKFGVIQDGIPGWNRPEFRTLLHMRYTHLYLQKHTKVRQ